MREQYSKIASQIINIGAVATVFIIPLLFIPLPQDLNNTRLFAEFNKEIAFVLVSFTLFTLWTIKMVLDRKVTIIRTPIDLPLIVFFLIYILATVFSSDPFVSVVGYYGIFHPSLVSMLALILFYFTAVSNLSPKTRIWALGCLVVSIGIASLVAIIHYFGIFITQYKVAQSRDWTPIISPGTLAFLASLSVPIAVGLAVAAKNFWVKLGWLVAGIIIFGSILIVNSFGAWIALFAGLLTILFFAQGVVNRAENRLTLGAAAIVAIVLFAVSMTPSLKGSIIKPLIRGNDKTLLLNAEKRLPVDDSWQIAVSSIGNKPFLGYGPGTFPFVFTKFSPISMNQGSDWNVRYEQASNEYANTLSTLGFLGLAAYLAVLFFLLRSLDNFCLRSSSLKDNPMPVFLLSSLIAFAVGSLFFDTSLVIGMLFILVSAAAFSTLFNLGTEGVDKVNLKLVSLKSGVVGYGSENPSNNLLGFILLVPCLAITAAALYFGIRSYQAELSYQRSVISASKNNAKETRDLLVSAIKEFSFRDIYHRTLSLVDIRIAQSLSRQTQTDQNKTNIQLLVSESVAQSRIATGYQNPPVPGTSSNNVVNWESLGVVYSSLIDVVKGTGDQTVIVYLQAKILFPRNPALYQSLGNVYLKIGKTQDAIRALETAVSLKNDLAFSHYSLAQAYEKAGNRQDDALKELEAAFGLLPEGSDKQKVQGEIDTLKKEIGNNLKQLTPTASTTATPSATATSSAKPK